MAITESSVQLLNAIFPAILCFCSDRWYYGYISCAHSFPRLIGILSCNFLGHFPCNHHVSYTDIDWLEASLLQQLERRNNDSGVRCMAARGAMRNGCPELGVISASWVKTTTALSGSLPAIKMFVLWPWRTWSLRQHGSHPIRRSTRRTTLIQIFSTIMT